MKKLVIIIAALSLYSCKEDFEKTKPIIGDITESIYASGYIKSENQYTIFLKVSGIVEHVYVASGDLVIQGSPIISIYDENQQLNSENAALTSKFYDFNSNVEKLNELFNQIDIAKSKRTNDSLQFDRQKQLKEKGVGTPMEYDNSELALFHQ